MGEKVRSVRNSCINQVLGTDMKKHFDIVSRFQVCFAPFMIHMSAVVDMLSDVLVYDHIQHTWIRASRDKHALVSHPLTRPSSSW